MKQKQAATFFTICFVVVSLIFAHYALAGGLYSSELNSPVSLGTAGVNNVVNNLAADAAVTNPAGMTGIKQDTLMPGFQLLIPEVRFDASIAEKGGSDGGNAADGGVIAIPGFNAVKILSDKWRFGFAVTAPLGGGVDYGDNSVMRYSASRSVLAGLGVSPSIGYKINDAVSVGVGVTAIYTNFDMDIAVNQGPLPDGKLSIDKIDDWSAQGFAGLTWQATEKAMLGVVYRTKAEIELEGDLDIRGVQIPLINRITSRLDEVKLDFDTPQVIAVGIAYDVSDNLRLVADFDWEEWSEFSDNYISIQSGVITSDIDRNWDDTWHVGIGALYKMEDSFLTAGASYDSSAVDDDDRTFDIPVDEKVTLGASYGRHVSDKLSYAFGIGYSWLGDGKIDQTSQRVRVKGEFDTNYFVSIGGNMRYQF